MRKPRVLMLGWEFPPIINGGLGVACLGLCKALSQHVELSMIIPKSDPNYMVNNVELIGLNNVEVENLKKIRTSKYYKEFAHVTTVEANIFPYETAESDFDIIRGKSIDFKLDTNVNIFKVGDLYGDDVINKVIEYAKFCARLAMTKDFDIIHCHDWMTFLAGIEIKALSGKPLVLHVHSLDYDRGGPDSRGWVYDIERWGMHYADAIIPVSRYTGSIAKNHYDVDERKIYPVHNGADPVHVFHDTKDFPEKLVLFLGRVTGQKGPEYFLDIASKVIEHAPNSRFVMAGTGDKLRGLIESGAYRQIGNKFHFTGFLNKEKVHKLLSIADVYVMPSVSEPFGLSALEAAQFGIPCVISKQSGVSEVLYGALKADFWDVDKMAGHIISLLQNDSLRESVVKDAFRDLENLTWDKAADKVADVYKRVL
ncbi:MAG: glycosyltransferase family 4 protein [Sporocytophaga sp.]|uniref:glycosyltransferase family 4 protein n=1 Tax=Sporocytophaga sp. TaxID=2231183 RepID=UPI001B0DB21F|nr:glycosyltransferase family 4 protein [Sporocytophaga sp.]MBO9699103.1 glycosyltransferase family 4 protein [Sporocytophaga sp.]